MNEILMKNIETGLCNPQKGNVPGFPDDTDSHLKGVCALISPALGHTHLDPALKAAAVLCVISVAGDLITVNQEGYRCNNGFIDSFCELHRCANPVVENLKVMAGWHYRDWFFMDKASLYFSRNKEGAIQRVRDYYDLLDRLGRWCMMTDEEKAIISFQELVIQVLSSRLYQLVVCTVYMSDTAPRSWDHDGWLRTFRPIWDRRIRSEQHAFRAAYYKQHIRIVQDRCYISQSGKRVEIPWDGNEMIQNSKMYSAPITVQPAETVYDTTVEVWNMDCLDAAKKLQSETEGLTAVLNLANRQTPGGGVYNGSGAQEESCFLRSNYFAALYPFSRYAAEYGLPQAKEQYPLDRDFGGVWSKDVTVFRGRELEGYPLLDAPWKTNFIAVPAINRPRTVEVNGETRLAPEMEQGTLNKIRTIMGIAADNQVTNLVLGALGCGAFRNPPKHVAELFRQVLSEPAYKGRFHRVVFAIINDDLCKVFEQVFQ